MPHAPSGTTPNPPRIWPWLDAILFALGLWFAGLQPVTVAGSADDDLLFVRLADNLRHGAWLGSFDNLTLAKGPFYPMFLAAADFAGVPPQLATEAVYLSGALVLARVVGTLAGQRGAATFCFAVLALNPVCFDWSANALMREPLYCGLQLLVLGVAARVFLCGGRVASGVALGAAAAAFWLTREEGILLAPALLPFLAWYIRAPAAAAWRRLRRLPAPAPACWPALLPPLAAAVTGAALVLCVCAINWHVYGVFRSVDFQTGPFPRAYGALARIVPDRPEPHIAVPRSARSKAYAVSAAARELQPFLDGPSPAFMRDVDCGIVTQPDCHDIPTDAFMWALREAVARAGHYTSARNADAFYRRLARDIEAACRNGAIACLPRRDSLVPPLGWNRVPALVSSLARASFDVATLGFAGPLPGASLQQGNVAATFRSVAFATRFTPLRPFNATPGWHIQGVLSYNSSGATLAVVPQQGGSAQASLRLQPVNAPPQSGYTARDNFDLDAFCQPPPCALQLQTDGRIIGTWPLGALQPDFAFAAAGAGIWVSGVAPLPPSMQYADPANLRRTLMHLCAAILPWLSAALSLPAICWLGWRAWRDVRRRETSPLTLLACGLFIVVAGRIAMLAVLDATAISLQIRYESPAMAPLLALIAIALARLCKE